MTTRELGELHDDIIDAFARLLLRPDEARQKVRFKPVDAAKPIILSLEDALNLIRNEIRGRLNAAIVDEVTQ